MAYKKIKSFEEFHENPFVEKAIEEIEIVKKTQIIRAKERSEVKLIIDDKSGHVEGHTAFMRFVEVEEEKFAKLYLSQLSVFWDLSKPAIRIFSYIMTILQPNKDSFYFIMEDCLNYTGYSHPKNVLVGITSLIESGIIARSNNHIRYFINPLVIFNGSRVTFAKTYIKKKREQELPEKKINNKLQISMFEEEITKK